MIVAYIAHPISGDIENNLKKIIEIVREINLKEPETIPFVPYYPDILALDDNNPTERERGIKNDTELLSRGFVDEIRLYGNKISKGMKAEVELGIKRGIAIKTMTPNTHMAFIELYPNYKLESFDHDTRKRTRNIC